MNNTIAGDDRSRLLRGYSGTALRAGLLLCVALQWITAHGSLAQTPSSGASEYAVKAGFLYNFAKFIQWPPDSFQDSATAITICIQGRDPFGETIDATVRGKTIGTRGLMIRRTTKLDELKGCHLIFVSGDEAKRLPEILENLKGSSSLVVGDSEGFAEDGGAIEFYLEDNKVRFSVNVDAIKRARLDMSSKVLALAKIVHDTERRKGT